MKMHSETILATVYLRKNISALIAIASWEPSNTTVKLDFDWAALGIPLHQAELVASNLESFNGGLSGKRLSIGEQVPIVALQGLLLELNNVDL